MARVAFLVLGCVVAFIAYRESENFKKANGVTPWNWPSWVWACVGFFSLVLAAILLVIARRSTKPRRLTWNQSIYAGGSPYTSLSTAPAPAPLPPAAWHPDPTGRHASRYWDGSRWTEHVNDGSSTTTDPLPA